MRRLLFDLENCDELDSGVDEVRLELDMPSPSTQARRSPRWLTQTLQEAQ